jgi:hypothetical protein
LINFGLSKDQPIEDVTLPKRKLHWNKDKKNWECKECSEGSICLATDHAYKVHHAKEVICKGDWMFF